MKVKLMAHAEDKELYSSTLNTRTNYKENVFSPSSALEDIRINELRFSGINYLFLQLQTKGTVHLRVNYTKPGYCACFVLDGECNFIDGINSRMQVNQYIFQRKQEIQWVSQPSICQLLFVCFDLDRIKGLQLTNPIPRTLPHHMSRVLAEIQQCTQACPIRCIFIESKVLSLLYLLCQDLSDEKHAPKNTQIVGLSEQDIQKLKQAEEYIVQHIADNYTLVELAHEVGLNDFKLKKGFKALFGSTVFNYRHSIRMIKAKEMLLSGFLVNEVSEEIGYKHAHHFSVAFKAYFDISPSKINGQ